MTLNSPIINYLNVLIVKLWSPYESSSSYGCSISSSSSSSS